MKARNLTRSLPFVLAAPLAVAASSSFVGGQGPALGTTPTSPAGEPVQLHWGDYDADGLDDALSITRDGALRLLRNVGDGSFEDATVQAGLDGIAGARFGVWEDFDADGLADLFVGARGEGRLFHNAGALFVDVTEASGLQPASGARAAHWVDYDADGRLDLHVVGGSASTMFHALAEGGFEAIELPVAPPAVTPGGTAATAGAATTGTGPALGGAGTDAGERPEGARSGGARTAVTVSGPDVTDVSSAGSYGETAPMLVCAPSLDDQASAGCIMASSTATLGQLYPLGTNFFVEDATGEVGIGTTSPAAKLHVADGSTGALVDGDARLVVERQGGSGDAWIQVLTADNKEGGILFGNPTTSSDGGLIWDDTLGALRLQAGGSDQMIIEESGDVGIGVASPSHPLHVAGKILSGTTTVSSGIDSAVGGGRGNSATGPEATVPGGLNNTASGTHATVGGGSTNTATGANAVVAGGAANDATGEASMVPGGFINKANGQYSMAAGFAATADHAGSFVWGDSQNVTKASSAVDEFNVYAEGGVRMFAAGTTTPSMIVDASGDVGIGTANPSDKLTLSTPLGERGMVQRAGTVAVGTYANATGGWYGTYSNHPLVLFTNNSFGDAVITSTGNFGIGTLTPAFKLEVNGSAGKPGGGSWSVSSDRRLKKNVHDLDGALDTLLDLRGVTFEYKDPEAVRELAGERIGFIAQEVEAVIPDWVEEVDGYKRLTIRGFEALAVEALREVDAENDELRSKCEALEARVAELESIETELASLRATVAALAESR